MHSVADSFYWGCIMFPSCSFPSFLLFTSSSSRTSFEVCVTLSPSPLGDWGDICTTQRTAQSLFLRGSALLPVCPWLAIFLGATCLNDFIYTIFLQCCWSLSKWNDENYFENSEVKQLLLSIAAQLVGGKWFIMVIMLLDDKAIKHSECHLSFEKTSL